MNADVQPGRYIIAVSGGVDSMALLHLLRDRPGIELIVAHFDHGIRSDSAADAELVRRIAVAYDLSVVTEAGNLGPQASEATARAARYAFLERVRDVYQARGIITAHHQDDVLETAILNLIRGTGRKGLTSLASSGRLVRPLLHATKQDIRNYADAHGIAWREDSTNADERYLRNYVRRQLLPRFDAAARAQFLEHIERARAINEALDTELTNLMHVQPHQHGLDRQLFLRLPHAVAKELLASWLRVRRVTAFDARTLERVVVAAKTLPPGGVIDVVGGVRLRVTTNLLALEHHER